MVMTPGMFSLAPEQIAAGKEAGNHLGMELSVHHKEVRVGI